MSFLIHNITILTVQKIAFSIYKICGFIMVILLELIRIYLSYFARETEIPVRLIIAFGWFCPLMKKNSRYSNIMGGKVLWIVEVLIFEGYLFPKDKSFLPAFKHNITFLYLVHNDIFEFFIFIFKFLLNLDKFIFK